MSFFHPFGCPKHTYIFNFLSFREFYYQVFFPSNFIISNDMSLGKVKEKTKLHFVTNICKMTLFSYWHDGKICENWKLLDTWWSITRRPRHLLGFWWKQRYKLALTIILHISQQVWWLEVTPGETYPLVDNSSTRNKKYSFSPSKHQLYYECLFVFISLC